MVPASNFNFCPACYGEGRRFLQVTDEQQESLHNYYELELNKKDDLMRLLQEQLDAQNKEHDDDMTKLRQEYESKLIKREDLITSLQNANCESRGLASSYIRTKRATLKAAKGNNESLRKIFRQLSPNTLEAPRQQIFQFYEPSELI